MRYNLTSVVGLPADVVDGMARAPGWAAMVAVAPTLLYDHSATHEITVDPDWRRRWAAVTMPAIVCSGNQTFPGMPEAADAVAAALPNASRRILPGQGHRPAPEAMVPVLPSWRVGPCRSRVRKLIAAHRCAARITDQGLLGLVYLKLIACF